MDAKGLTAFFTASVHRQIEEANARIATYNKRAKDYRNAIPIEKMSYESKIKDYEQIAASADAVAKTETEKVTKLTASITKEEKKAAKKAELDAQRFAKHKGVKDVVVNGSRVIITTPLVWVNIRKAAGSKESQRTCIGAYKFMLDYTTYCVEVQNLIFERHWSLNGLNPCLGEYEAEIKRLMTSKRLYEVWDLMYHWLIGADRDAASYMPSHSWRDQYRKIPIVQPKELQVGGFVVCTENVDGYNTKGEMGIIAEIDNNVAYRVIFKRRIRGITGSHWFGASPLYPISQKKFNSADKFTVTIKNGIVEKLDKMKKGTFDDYKKLAAVKGRVTLTPTT